MSSGRHMALVALRPRVADVAELEAPGASSLQLEELRIDRGSPLADRTIGEALTDSTVLAVRHEDGIVTANPPNELRLRVGDLVLLLGEGETAAVG